MAGEIGHIVYGNCVLKSLNNDKIDTLSFWVGTLFPDIRHLGVVSRHHTHPDDVTLSSLSGKNDFVTGLRAHTWVDAVRENFLREKKIKEVLPWHPFVPHALKLLEDELLYDDFDDWELIQRALSSVNENEQHYVQDNDVINRWHDILRKYFTEKPSDESRKELSINIGLSESSAIEINNVINILKEEKTAIEILNEFKSHLKDILK